MRHSEVMLKNCCPTCGSIRLFGVDEEKVYGEKQSSCGSVRCANCDEVNFCDNCEARSSAERSRMLKEYRGGLSRKHKETLPARRNFRVR